jgi:RNA-directed DNA polymerase
MQLSLFSNSETTNLKQGFALEVIFKAYFSCRNNKRNTINALDFELDYENNLIQLWNELNDGSYQPGKSIAFIVHKPVQREIFAADFRDRVVHHLIINKLNPLFEKEFIQDSYACRVGKGTHHGISRANKFIRQCSKNYTKDCHVLKLDIEGFFMHINKEILFSRLEKFIETKYQQPDKELVLEICYKIINNSPIENCIIKGSSKNWNGLPTNKSLFHSPQNSGLPIGNLTSQIFANFYMSAFDHFMKKELGIRFYGRYVDDFIIIHPDKEYLKSLIPAISNYLNDELKLTLHPKKIYLQHYTKGVKFLGTVIKPNRIYIANRTKGNFYNAIQQQNKIIETRKPTKDDLNAFLSSMNSYLGIMIHYKTYHLRKRMIFKHLNGYWLNHVYLSGGIAKFVLKNKPVKKRKRWVTKPKSHICASPAKT